jgi:monofunctional biosynthetic peptidoglycan transglycosylase
MAIARRRARVQPRGKASKRRVGRLLWRPVRIAFRAALLLVLLAVLWVAAYRVVDPPGGVYMASEAWRLGGVERDWRDLDEIAPAMARSVVAAEDARFCDHLGFDLEAIREAIEASREGGRVRGASTISQQVAKNVFLWHGRSWGRKGLEAGFTVLIEALWPKRRVLEVYLNTAELAPGVFGAEAAGRYHFGRGADALGPDQAARLAAVLPNPKERSASRPSAFVAKRAQAIRAGAETLAAEGRDACFR